MCLAGSCYSNSYSQEKNPVWIYFSGKGEVNTPPQEYFSAPALERRAALGIGPFDQTDLPVKEEYLSIISHYCVELCGSSRWLNAALVIASEDQLQEISRFPFIKDIQPSFSTGLVQAQVIPAFYDLPDEELARQQLAWHEAELLREKNLSGKGICIAVFDGGFPGVDTHPAFVHLHQNNQIVATWDFARQSTDVYKYNAHGTAVLSCIAGYAGLQPTGLAPDAKFLLARTEISGEPWKEELYWIQAAEWADKMGANIISSSLGYTYHRYFVRDMTGHDTPVAKAANIAARKGILVVNCIGNDGNKDWKYAVTPADADSVLSVGGINPDTGIHIEFSSYGPNMSGSLKPNVVASGKVMAASPRKWKTLYGTSFSATLIAGFAACAWQLNPSMNNMEIFDLIQRSGHLYPYYDFAHGYGIPKASKLLSNGGENKTEVKSSLKVSSEAGSIKVEIEDEELKDPTKWHYLYFNLRDANDKIVRYGIYQIQSGLPVIIEIKESENIKSCYLRTEASFQIFKILS